MERGQSTHCNQLGTHRTELSYDGLNRHTQIIEKENSAVTEDRRLVWLDLAVVDERQSSGAVTKRFFDRGVQDAGISYFQVTDHLGSTVVMTDNGGIVQARYEYAPFGQSSRVQGSYDAPFTFAGTMSHGPSGLALATFRMYDPAVGRWINQDPIGLRGGVNLYVYAEDSPIRYNDPSGLAMWVCVRRIHGPLKAILANHSYFWNDRNNSCCGALSRTNCSEGGPGRDACVKIADSSGSEDNVMRCCRSERTDQNYWPVFNNCFADIDKCLAAAGLKNPHLGGTIGPLPPCKSCSGK